jgi:hypothetical protein
MGRGGQEGIAAEGEQIDAIALADPGPTDSAFGCEEIASVT